MLESTRKDIDAVNDPLLLDKLSELVDRVSADFPREDVRRLAAQIIVTVPALIAVAKTIPLCIDALDRLLGDTDFEPLSVEAQAMRTAVLRLRALDAKLREVL